jgi:hypothetical protein
MNPDTGKFHEAMTEDEAEAQRKRLEKLSDALGATEIPKGHPLIAEDVPEAGLKKGDPIPREWPMFEIGELIPIKGFHFKLERIEDHRLVLTFHGMTKAEKRRRGR